MQVLLDRQSLIDLIAFPESVDFNIWQIDATENNPEFGIIISCELYRELLHLEGRYSKMVYVKRIPSERLYNFSWALYNLKTFVERFCFVSVLSEKKLKSKFQTGIFKWQDENSNDVEIEKWEITMRQTRQVYPEGCV